MSCEKMRGSRLIFLLAVIISFGAGFSTSRLFLEQDKLIQAQKVKPKPKKPGKTHLKTRSRKNNRALKKKIAKLRSIGYLSGYHKASLKIGVTVNRNNLTYQGRAFEVTPQKKIVWKYYSPYRSWRDKRLGATLFEMIRLDPDFPLAWLEK